MDFRRKPQGKSGMCSFVHIIDMQYNSLGTLTRHMLEEKSNYPCYIECLGSDIVKKKKPLLTKVVMGSRKQLSSLRKHTYVLCAPRKVAEIYR